MGSRVTTEENMDKGEQLEGGNDKSGEGGRVTGEISTTGGEIDAGGSRWR